MVGIRRLVGRVAGHVGPRNLECDADSNRIHVLTNVFSMILKNDVEYHKLQRLRAITSCGAEE
jgi:hypothetical protein